MAVDPLNLDNPLDAGKVPRHNFPIRFPARHHFEPLAVLHSGFMLLVGALCGVGVAYVFVYLSPQYGIAVANSSGLLVIVLAVMVIVRWESRSLPAFYATLVVAILCLVSVASLTFASSGNQSLTATCSLVMLALLWNAAEVAIHFQSIDVEVMRHDPTLAKQRRERNGGSLQQIAVLVAAVECFALWAPIRLVLVPATAAVAVTVAYLLVADLAKYPYKFLLLTIKHYLGYPESSTLAPGLIESAAPIAVLRLFPLAIVIVGSAMVAIADRTAANAAVGAAMMTIVGLLTGVAAMLVGASLSARPIHFDVDRTPFDLVISKIRDWKKDNV